MSKSSASMYANLCGDSAYRATIAGCIGLTAVSTANMLARLRFSL